MNTIDTHTGGCYCGKIRYELSAPPEKRVLCHCENCRRISGGQAVPWIITREADFRIISGTPKSYLSETGATWSFCPSCGSTLTYKGFGYTGQLDVTLVSLDHHKHFPPSGDAHSGEKLDWVAPAPGN